MRQFIVVSYDISDDRRRTKVMKTLKNFGTHIQYSVFECRLEAAQFTELKHRLKRLAAPGDSIRLYFLCDTDTRRTQVLGSGEVTPDSLFYLH